MITIQEYLLSKSNPKTKQRSTIVANDNNIFDIIDEELKKLGTNANLNHIDVSGCTSFFDINHGGVFDSTNFHGDVSEWDVSNIKNMENLFFGCREFNGDLSKWDVSKVKCMRNAFRSCKAFNQPLSTWDVSNVENMEHMFYKCDAFNQDISNWKVSKCENFDGMFGYCFDFDQDLSNWEISENASHSYMFYDCSSILTKHMPKIYQK